MIAERYRIDTPLGRGGMGEVFRGTDLLMDRPVAIKLVRADRIGDEESARRFLREGRITARLDHPGVPVIFEQGRIDDPASPLHGRLYLAMQFIEGINADDLAAEHDPLPIGWAAAIAAQVCAVLHYAHQRRVIHRDIKPGNLMITPDGYVKVLDFGLATALGDPGQSAISMTGVPIGTTLYMAPEQFGDNDRIGPATDLYALGLVVHRLLAGAALFESRSFSETLRDQILTAPTPLRALRPDTPPEIEELVLTLLAKDPDDRPNSAVEVFHRLLPHAENLPELPGAVGAEMTPARMYASIIPPRAHGPAAPPSVTPGDIDKARRQANGLARSSRSDEAVELLVTTAHRAATALGADDSTVLAVRRDAADLLMTNGRYGEAARSYATLVGDLTRRDGHDAETVFDVRQREADCLIFAAEPHLGLAKLRDLLTDQTTVYGSFDTRTLELRRRLCLLLEGMGRERDAVVALQDLITEVTGHHGQQHPLTRTLADDLERMRRTR